MAENQPYVNILVGSSKGQKGPEVVLTPTTVLRLARACALEGRLMEISRAWLGFTPALVR